MHRKHRLHSQSDGGARGKGTASSGEKGGSTRGASLVAVHGHPLRASAHLAVGRGADGPAAVALGTALLQGQQLLGAERLVMDLRRGLDQILEVSPEKEVPQVDEFAVVLVLDVDDAPSVLPGRDLLAVDNDGLLGADDSERNQRLQGRNSLVYREGKLRVYRQKTHSDLGSVGALLIIMLVVVIGEHLQVVEGELLLDALLEGLALLQRQGVGLGDDGDDVDHVRKLLQDDDVDGLQRVPRRLDEEEAAVDAGVGDVSLALGGELLAQVGRVLVLDVLDDGVPAPVVVDQVVFVCGVDDVQPEPDAVLLDDERNRVDLGGGPHDLFGVQPALGLDQVGGEDGVDQGRLAQTSLAYAARKRSSRHVSVGVHSGGSFDATQRRLGGVWGGFYSPTQMMLNWKPRFRSFRSIWDVMLSKPTWL